MHVFFQSDFSAEKYHSVLISFWTELQLKTRVTLSWNHNRIWRDLVFPVQVPHAFKSQDVKMSASSDEIQLEEEEN
jgi:hypothetical protein